jgi:cbb3-type cytochrome oxidase maturation protein
MDESTILLIVLSLCLGAGCWLIFIWAVKKGEFEDVEKPKHRMLDDD